MVIVEYNPSFESTIKKIKHQELKERIIKQIKKILASPEVGKPMRFSRKNTREVYIPPFRLSYLYLKEEGKIVFLDLYRKDGQ